MRVLLTGGTGFIGRNMLPILEERFEVTAPRRSELALLDAFAVSDFLAENQFRAVIHCANPNAVKNPLDLPQNTFEESLRIFSNLYAARSLYGKLLYLGSGAEYDKSLEIASVREVERTRSIPRDGYGFAKYLMSELAQGAKNVHNLCVFACYGPGDHESKFITHCIRCCLRGEHITIRQDCYFDYLQVTDLGRAMTWFVDHEPEHMMYNITSGTRVLLSEIAAEVCRQMGNTQPVEILTPGMNREYTGDNSRFVRESGVVPSVSLEQGIAMQIEWETRLWQESNH